MSSKPAWATICTVGLYTKIDGNEEASLKETLLCVCAWICVCMSCMYNAHGGQREGSSLELELQMLVSCSVTTGSRPRLLEEQPMRLAARLPL